MASNASHMLEAALEQMDDIIAGKSGEKLHSGQQPLEVQNCKSQHQKTTSRVESTSKAPALTDIVEALLEVEECNKEHEKHALAIQMRLQEGEVNHQSSDRSESYQERLSRLEGDKESLILQVGVLTDQVEAQEVKISDLQSSVVKHRLKLNATEEMLQQELVHRTSLEKQKLSLMGEVSYLKLKLSDMEEKPGQGTERQHKAESVVNFISELQEQMCRFQKEINSKIQEKKASEIPADSGTPAPCPATSRSPEDSHASHSCNAATEVKTKLEEEKPADGLDENSPDAEQLRCDGGESALLRELKSLKGKVERLEDEKIEYEKRLKATKVEISGLQQRLLSKDAEIESLHTQLLARPPLSTECSERDEELQRLKSDIKSLEAAHDEKDRRLEELTLLLNQCRQFRDLPHNTRQAPPAGRSLSNGGTHSSSSEEEEQGQRRNADSASAKSEDVTSDVSTSSAFFYQTSPASQKDNDCRQETHTSSSSMNDLPDGQKQKRDSRSPMLPARSSPTDSSTERSPDDSEDGDFSQLKSEKVNNGTGTNSPPGQRTVGSPDYIKTNRSLRRLWGKLRRTHSGGTQASDSDAGPFTRGGFRATAGARLTRTPESQNSVCDMNLPFSQWSRDQVCSWLEDYGLGQYCNLTRQWVESGQTLIAATPQDLEKEMGMKHPLHRKKLQLALRAFTNKVAEKSASLDHIWVTRWLDDIGLPQYKDQFHEARVDGRMIQYLTVNDLLSLKVTSQLHHLSIKCAIHVLHANKFNPHYLRRRPGEEPSPSEVVQWSNHRVMEWLRAVDLAEYAPNLRGSGVHGGLIILEPRFSPETLALLLNIPPQKTLLRRHLAMAFATLVGAQATQEKREYGNATGHMPLTTTAKVKPKKLGFTQFSHLRKRKPDESADYICPIEGGALSFKGVSRLPSAALRDISPNLDRQPKKQEQSEGNTWLTPTNSH
ncbi:liprin-beta-2 isoform X3 [Nerophis ophidion]|uniref:liprin-beta-2 isoform X3 n=1 Tax=Nerophis ophidion TaxID=159077 RepID=UPI002ADF9CA8|nr:liprin-beta-2 isoform X3 [Nerophis ophidion]